MSWIFGTATDYQDLSDKLVAAATGNSVASVDSVAAGGSGYSIGDIITLTGGTFSVAAQLEVVTLSGSAVATVRIYNAGVYTVNPSDPVAQGSTDGSGTGATFNLTFGDNGWTELINTGNAVSAVASIVSGGTGYSVNDVITLTGGDAVTAVQLTVLTVAAGVITSVSITEAGEYHVIPSDPVAQGSVAPSGGSGATFNLTWSAGEKIVMLEGDGSGTDEIYVGWRTLSGAGYYNFELRGMTGHTASLPIFEQPGASNGNYDNALAANRAGSYLLCHNSALYYWISIDSYHLTIQLKVGAGGYFNAYLGYGDPFGTTSEIPYPMCIAGHTTAPFDLSTQSKLSSGLTDPWSASSYPAYGPMQVLNVDNTWYQVTNGEVSVGSRTQKRDRCVVPSQQPQGYADADQEDKFMYGASGALPFDNIIPNTILSGTPDENVEPTDGTDDAYPLLPSLIVMSDPVQVLMELKGVFWTSTFGNSGEVNAEDRFIVDGVAYRVFPNCNRTDTYAYLAIKEA